jgi:hypothetical protein
MMYVGIAMAQPAKPAPSAAPIPPVSPPTSLSFSTQDEANLRAVCQYAVDAQRDLSTKASIGEWCLSVLGRASAAHGAQVTPRPTGSIPK